MFYVLEKSNCCFKIDLENNLVRFKVGVERLKPSDSFTRSNVSLFTIGSCIHHCD